MNISNDRISWEYEKRMTSSIVKGRDDAFTETNDVVSEKKGFEDPIEQQKNEARKKALEVFEKAYADIGEEKTDDGLPQKPENVKERTKAELEIEEKVEKAKEDEKITERLNKKLLRGAEIVNENH